MKPLRNTWLAILSLSVIGVAPARAQAIAGFKDVKPRVIAATLFTDQELTGLLGTLDDLLERDTDPDQWGIDAGHHLSEFVERVQAGRLSAAQERRVVDHLSAIEQQHPADADVVE